MQTPVMLRHTLACLCREVPAAPPTLHAVCVPANAHGSWHTSANP